MTEHSNREKPKDSEPQQRLLALIAEMARELQPSRSSPPTPTMQSRLDRDLGLDSLARSELLLRIENAFEVKLPEAALMAETPAALLEAVQTAQGKSTSAHTAIDTAPASVQEAAAILPPRWRRWRGSPPAPRHSMPPWTGIWNAIPTGPTCSSMAMRTSH
ncbi:acyl carrier protein [Halomonas sp. BC04]|uniref:acyl carrier protein n=1 Tax=Halomonas sp. BC04 TaxID=1403540 RepID=UPI0009DF5EE4